MDNRWDSDEMIDNNSTLGRIAIECEVFVTGEGIKREREKLGMTQVDLAKLLGVAMNTVSRWEIGQRNPHPLTLKAIRTVLAEVQAKKAKARKRRDS